MVVLNEHTMITKASNGFLRQVGDTLYLLPSSGQALSVSRVFKLNRTGELVWREIDTQESLHINILLILFAIN